MYSLLGAVRVRLFDLEVETGGAPDGLPKPLGQKPGLPLPGIHVVFHGVLSTVVHCKQMKNTQLQREGTVFSSLLVHLDQVVITGMILIICFSDVYNLLRSYNGIKTCMERPLEQTLPKLSVQLTSNSVTFARTTMKRFRHSNELVNNT